jgi:hypothetical protein
MDKVQIDNELINAIASEIADERGASSIDYVVWLCSFAREFVRRYLARTAEQSKRSVNAVMVAGRDVDEVKQ